MPYVPVTERDQAKTTGINGQLKLGRAPNSLTEYDCKNAKISARFNNQDKTGSMSKGHEDSEVGVIGYDLSGTLINHVDSPINLFDKNNKYYAEYTVHGHGVFTGFVRLSTFDSGHAANGDHDISFTAKACAGKVDSAVVTPEFTEYDPG